MVETSLQYTFFLISILFVGTQFIYFINNVGVISLYLEEKKIVPDREPEETPHIHVLIAAYQERKEILEETLKSVYGSEYPADRITAYLVYEEHDDVIGSYADELDVEPIVVETDDPVWERIQEDRHMETMMMPKNKARALTYALYTRDFDGVITVLDSDTGFGPELFKLGIVGLEEYDIVQAKQTVRNIGDGWLPLLESMGVAAWCATIYERAVNRPYQLLGKAYFIRTEDLYDLRGWNPYTITEDMYLGIEAYNSGYSLGVIDYYIQDLCPVSFDSWVKQKTRWVHGPYEILSASLLNWREKIQFMSYTVTNQVISLTNVVGVPVGLIVFFLFLTGNAPTFPLYVTAMVGVNLIVWIHYVINSYRVSLEAIDFDSWNQGLRYYVISNFFTQLVYATLWALPILLAIRAVWQKKTLSFEVTPK